MAWQEPDGSLEPIPMTADQFEPALGAVVKLNGHVLSATPSQGKWTRQGQTWKFKTNGSARSDAFTLKLDFGRQAWDFEGQKLPLSDHFKATDSHAMVILQVNDMYGFRFDIEQEVKSKWEITLTSTDPQKLEVTKYSGSFGWPDREDKILLEGRLPETLDGFGDFSFIVNGHQRDVLLLSLADFQRALAEGKELVFKEGGTHAVIDFGKKKWSVELAKDQFSRILTPRWGKARLGIKVGGASCYSQEHAITQFASKLTYKG